MLTRIMEIVEREQQDKRGCLELLITNRLESLSLTFVKKVTQNYRAPISSTMETAMKILSAVPNLQNSVIILVKRVEAQ